MQVRPRRATGLTDLRDHLTRLNLLTFMDMHSTGVRVPRAMPIWVCYFHQIAVATPGSYPGDNARSRGADRGALRGRNIDTAMMSALVAHGIHARTKMAGDARRSIDQ